MPFYVKNDGGARPGTSVTHEANVPTDRNGYHLILAVWEIADTGNAFYQVIDVNLVNNGLASNNVLKSCSASSYFILNKVYISII